MHSGCVSNYMHQAGFEPGTRVIVYLNLTHAFTRSHHGWFPQEYFKRTSSLQALRYNDKRIILVAKQMLRSKLSVIKKIVLSNFGCDEKGCLPSTEKNVDVYHRRRENKKDVFLILKK